jgi:cell division protein FtsL
MAFAWPHLQTVRLGYDLHRLQLERSQLAQLNAELKVERAALRSPVRIEEVARKELGLVDPRPGQFIWVRLSSQGVLSSREDTGKEGDP